MYDTSNPYKWKYYKTVYYPYGQWTITDASLSPDNKFLAYSSIKSVIALATTDPNDDSEPWLLDVLQMRNPMPHLSNYFGVGALLLVYFPRIWMLYGLNVLNSRRFGRYDSQEMVGRSSLVLEIIPSMSMI